MSESCNSKPHFSSLLISDLILFCSFILSHPLYLSYFIFFAPYLLRLVSFLSPLFITTFLLSLAFLTGYVHENFYSELAQTRVLHLLSGDNLILEKFRFKKHYHTDEFQCLDELGMYEILFGSSVNVMEVRESQAEFLDEKSDDSKTSLLQGSDQEDPDIVESEDLDVNKVEINSFHGTKLENTFAGMEEKRRGNFLKIIDEFERMACNVEERKKFEPSRGTKTNKVVEKQKAAGTLFRNGSEATGNKRNDANQIGVNSSNGGKVYNTPMVKAHSQRITCNVDRDNDDDDDDEEEDYRKPNLKAESSRALEVNSLGSYGSTRKDKEWKRTLACKLFEERHNVDGGEGMDSLWEAYEMDSNKATSKQKNAEKKKNQNKKKSVARVNEEYYGNEEEEEIGGQLCCLQALKLSAGKMNLGMGRPNLVKFSKAIKGIGWLHHVSRHSKKVHNNNGDRN